MSSRRTLTHRSAADSILIAVCPIALMLFLTKSTSTSEAYLSGKQNQHIHKLRSKKTCSFNSLNRASTLFSPANLTMISNFSTLTYSGSLYLQKKTLISFDKISVRFCSRRLMFRNATHCTSGGEDNSVTRGGAIFLTNCLTSSSLLTLRM